MKPPQHMMRSLWRVLAPTDVQALGAAFLSVAIILTLQSRQLLALLGISSQAVDATSMQFNDRFGAVITSPITGKLVLLTFWAGIGLVVYLVCWSVYNLLISARNEVTVQTQYTNRTHWDGPWAALLFKVLAAMMLLAYVSSFSYGISTWVALSAPVFQHPSLDTGIMALVAILGLAAQLYMLLVILQLLFTPWYTNSPFTEPD